MSNVVWERSTRRATVQIVTSPNWKGGKPINPKIPKWLVKIKDHFLKDDYCPTDHELTSFVLHTFDVPELKLIVEAFKLKEEHNLKNLKNPEIRNKEMIFEGLVEKIRLRRGQIIMR